MRRTCIQAVIDLCISTTRPLPAHLLLAAHPSWTRSARLQGVELGEPSMIIHLERPKKYATQTTQTLEGGRTAQSDRVSVDDTTPIVLVIHGGAGGTIPPNMSPEMDAAYRARMRVALLRGYEMLSSGHSALDSVCRAVVELENDPLFNAARGAVFDRAGQIQCEASVMVAGPPLPSSSGGVLPEDGAHRSQGDSGDEKAQGRSVTVPANRRTAAVTLVRHTKNPILLARALYLHPSCAENVLFSGEEAEKLGWQLGCEKVDRDYYWTRRRWLEHRRDLGLPDDDDTAHQVGDAEGETIPPPYVSRQDVNDDETGDLSQHPVEITASQTVHENASDEQGLKTDNKNEPLLDLPRGTVGAVALDSFGRLACATSTGGKTNKFPGRIGDTPSVGAGYWAEMWQADNDNSATASTSGSMNSTPPPTRRWTFFSCMSGSDPMEDDEVPTSDKTISANPATKRNNQKTGVAISGTGDGDYFQRTSFASLVAHRMKLLGESSKVAAQQALAELTAVGGKGTGGAIILDAQGRVSFPLNSATMNRGVISSSTGAIPRVAIYATEKCK